MGAAAPVLRPTVIANRTRRGVALSLLAAAMLAGPVQAACSSCCPPEPQRELAVGPMDCCGDQCAPSLERAPADSVPAGSYRSCPASTSIAFAAATIPLPGRVSDAPAAASFALPPPPLPAPSPPRL